MSKWEIFIAWLVIVAICFVVWTAPKYVEVKGHREEYDETYWRDVLPLIHWSTVTQRVILIALVGIGLVLPGRRAKSRKVEMSIERGFQRLTFVVSIITAVIGISIGISMTPDISYVGECIGNACYGLVYGFVATWAVYGFIKYIAISVVRYIAKGFKHEGG